MVVNVAYFVGVDMAKASADSPVGWNGNGNIKIFEICGLYYKHVRVVNDDSSVASE
jgi:hypothetical protein